MTDELTVSDISVDYEYSFYTDLQSALCLSLTYDRWVDCEYSFYTDLQSVLWVSLTYDRWADGISHLSRLRIFILHRPIVCTVSVINIWHMSWRYQTSQLIMNIHCTLTYSVSLTYDDIRQLSWFDLDDVFDVRRPARQVIRMISHSATRRHIALMFSMLFLLQTHLQTQYSALQYSALDHTSTVQ